MQIVLQYIKDHRYMAKHFYMKNSYHRKVYFWIIHIFLRSRIDERPKKCQPEYSFGYVQDCS